MIYKNKHISISVIIPVYQSSETLKELHKRLVRVLNKHGHTYEIIYVDDDSRDNSWEILKNIYEKDKQAIIIQLTQNYGQHNALMCGFAHAKGQFIITLDDDLQNPPEEIPKLIDKIKDGFAVVYGEYRYKKHSIFRNLGSFMVQTIYKLIFKIPGNLTSFRIIRRQILEGLLQFDRNYTFIDGILAWQTKNIGYVQVEHAERVRGHSGYNMVKLLKLSLDMLTNFSIFPLQLASITGFVLSILGIGMGVYFVIKKIFFGIPVTGFASLIATITVFSGVQLITLGLIGEYIGRIHLNLNNKPQYRIKKIRSHR